MNRLGSTTAIAGWVPEVDRIRMVPEFGAPIEAAPFSYAGFTSRFYQATLPQDYTASVEWLATDGSIIATYEVDHDSAAGFGEAVRPPRPSPAVRQRPRNGDL